MMLLFENSITHLMTLLAMHPDGAYSVLFLGAFFETLIGTCFFIPGEVFLLSGSILAGYHVLSLPLVLVALYGGAVAGDSSSYFIGRITGPSIFRPERRFLTTENYHKGEALFEKYGMATIFFARFLGPISWITPFLAGVYKVPYRRFLPFNLAGILLGAGQFIVAGYFLGRHSAALLPLAQRYFFLLFLVGGALFVLFYYRKKKQIS